MTECYECARLAELTAENSKLRVKCDEHDEAERDWERKFNEAMGKEYSIRQELIAELDELRAGEWAKADNAIRELSEENDELRVERDALVDALGATDAIEWSQEQLENANPALVNALKAHDTREKPWHERVDDYLATFDDSREKLLENPQNMALQGWNHILFDAPENQLFVLDEDNMRRLYHIGFMDCKEGQYNIPAHGLNNIEYIALSDYESKRQYRDQQKRSMDVDSENDSREKLEADMNERLGELWADAWDAGYRDSMDDNFDIDVFNSLLDRQAAITEQECIGDAGKASLMGVVAHERECYDKRIAELQARVDELTEQLESAYAKNRSLRAHIAKMQEGRHGWHVKYPELLKRSAELKARVDELERENARLSSDEFYLRCTLVDINGEVVS